MERTVSSDGEYHPRDEKASVAYRVDRAVEDAFPVAFLIQDHFKIFVAVRNKARISAFFAHVNRPILQQIAGKFVEIRFQSIAFLSIFLYIIPHNRKKSKLYTKKRKEFCSKA